MEYIYYDTINEAWFIGLTNAENHDLGTIGGPYATYEDAKVATI